MKQDKIRLWLERKDAEEMERQRADEEEARQNVEELEQRQQKRLAREAAETRQKRGRLQAAARRKQDLELEVQRVCDGGWAPAPLSLRGDGERDKSLKTPRGSQMNGMTSALAAYGKPRPVSARARAR